MKHAFTRQSIANSKVQAKMHTYWNNRCNPDTQYSNTWTMDTSHDCRSNTKSIIIIIYIKKNFKKTLGSTGRMHTLVAFI